MNHLVETRYPRRSWRSRVISHRSLLISLCVIALTMGTVGSALAITLNFSSLTGATITFDGHGNFSFPPTGDAYDIQVEWAPIAMGFRGPLRELS